MRHIKAAVLLACCVFQVVVLAQVRAGSPEGDLFDKITRETNPEIKLELVDSFEKQFPTSKILPRVYLAAVEVYRQTGDREKIKEFGEKALRLDSNNITAMMILARNYAMESKNVDRALELAQRALDSATKMRSEPMPTGYSESQWKDYVRSNEDAAGQILEYVKAVKGRLERIAATPSTESTSSPTASSDASKNKP
jgi:tetratricopeptide (TPR) repeat protein